MKIKFAREGNEIGEHPEDDVPELLKTGALTGSDHFWHEGMTEWQTIESRWGKKRRRKKLPESSDVSTEQAEDDSFTATEREEQLAWYKEFEQNFDLTVQRLISEGMLEAPRRSRTARNYWRLLMPTGVKAHHLRT